MYQFKDIIALSNILLIIPVIVSQKAQKKGSCKCEVDHGTIDLEKLAHSDGTPAFSIQNTVQGKTESYYYNPCYQFSVGPTNSNCQNVAMCLKNDSNDYVDIGEQPSMDCMYDSSRQSVYMKYSTTSGPNVSFVYLRCSNADSLTAEGTISTTYVFTLSSPCACPDGCVNKLSVGSILCIVFVSLVLTYFVVEHTSSLYGSCWVPLSFRRDSKNRNPVYQWVLSYDRKPSLPNGSVLYNKAVYGATGVELIPHARFWASLPGLIKDGYLFFISPCLGERVEYRTYQQL